MGTQGVYCNAHRSRDGCWVDASQVEQTPEGRLKLYVARHGHGTYPKVKHCWETRPGSLVLLKQSHTIGLLWPAPFAQPISRCSEGIADFSPCLIFLWLSYITAMQAGVWWRAGLMANDLTSDKGVVWEADTVYLLPQLKPQAGMSCIF